jgi:hypothetical protein
MGPSALGLLTRGRVTILIGPDRFFGRHNGIRWTTTPLVVSDVLKTHMLRNRNRCRSILELAQMSESKGRTGFLAGTGVRLRANHAPGGITHASTVPDPLRRGKTAGPRSERPAPGRGRGEVSERQGAQDPIRQRCPHRPGEQDRQDPGRHDRPSSQDRPEVVHPGRPRSEA